MRNLIAEGLDDLATGLLMRRREDGVFLDYERVTTLGTMARRVREVVELERHRDWLSNSKENHGWGREDLQLELVHA